MKKTPFFLFFLCKINLIFLKSQQSKTLTKKGTFPESFRSLDQKM